MSAAPTDWRPAVADVAAVLAQRTGDRHGDAQATFTADTVPTSAQVAMIVGQVQAEVATRIGAMHAALATPLVVGDGPGATPAGHVVAVGAASYVELQFYPDQQLNTDSPASALWLRYRTLLDDLARAAADLADDGVLDGAATVLLPAATFPVAAPIQWRDL